MSHHHATQPVAQSGNHSSLHATHRLVANPSVKGTSRKRAAPYVER
jgi:hypothetical protein